VVPLKIALLADIHANADALEAVLHHIDQRKETEQIFSLGDNIGIGEFPSAPLR